MIAILLFLLLLGNIRILLLLPIKHFRSRLQNNLAIEGLSDIKHFPMWTILVPIFKESPYGIEKLRTNLKKIKYPNVEIVYLCEEIDILATQFFANLANEFAENLKEKVCTVPRMPPFTKPKACNYGLEIARGEYITIYDVEDAPHPHQLHAALYYFNETCCDCVQFALEFLHDGTILSGWQRIDYIIWYQNLLPILQKLKAPIPLGGTSNHFKTNVLRKIGGWKSYNVTEDAELGLRMKIFGYKTYYVQDYETKEPTLFNIVNLVNQRVRWSKGHILTFLETFPRLFVQSSMNVLFTFFVLGSSCVSYIGYIYITLFLDFTQYSPAQQNIIAVMLIWGIILFFMMPIILLWRFPVLRKIGILPSVISYNVYVIFYIIPMTKALIECVTKPSVWYKTVR